MNIICLKWILGFLVFVTLSLPIQGRLTVDRPHLSSTLSSFRSGAVVNVPQQPLNNDAYFSVAEHTTEHKLTRTNLVVNIVADLCPHGMMPLAFGLAQAGTTGWATAIALLVLFSSMSAYTMTSYAEMSKETNTQNIGQIWSKLVDPRTEGAVHLSIFLLCFGCCVFYSAFIGDIFATLASAVGLTGLLAQRWVVLLSMTLFVLLPLCLLEDLSTLKFSSLLGACGILYTVAFHALRLWDGSYAPGSEFLQHVPSKMLPSWPRPPLNAWKINSGTLVLINMLCVAFLAHYNAISYSEELENPTATRYNTAIGVGFGLSTAVFLAMMFMGYQLFGEVAQPLLLNNFPLYKDRLATLARAATGLAITFAYPLMFTGLKASLYNMIGAYNKPTGEVTRFSGESQCNLTPKNQSKSTVNQSLSAGLSIQTKRYAVLGAVAAITVIALQCGEEDVSVVLGIVGSVLGCFVAYVLPGMLKIALHKQRAQAGQTINRRDYLLNQGLVGVGLLFGALGVWITVKTEVEKLKLGGHGH